MMTKFDARKLNLILGIVLIALAAFKVFVAHERPGALFVLGMLNLTIPVLARKQGSR